MQQQHTLNREPIGVVMLDEERRLVGFDATAEGLFGEARLRESLGQRIESLHPEHSRSKIEWLLQQARTEQASREASMLINVSSKLLQVRVIGLSDARGPSGYCLLVHDVPELSSRPTGGELDEAPGTGCLYKLPVSKHGRIALLEMADVALLRAQGHYTDACAGGRHHFCGLSLSQLEPRLPPERFVKVHRSCIVNLAYATAIARRNDQLVLSLAGLCAHEIPVSRGKATHVRALLGV
jgi:DNA-binding LytR/AlgR family response regulator